MSKESSVIIQRNKEKLQERLIKSIKFFLKKKKNKKRQYGLKRYKNFPEDEKQKLVESRKNIKHRKIKMLHK